MPVLIRPQTDLLDAIQATLGLDRSIKSAVIRAAYDSYTTIEVAFIGELEDERAIKEVLTRYVLMPKADESKA